MIEKGAMSRSPRILVELVDVGKAKSTLGESDDVIAFRWCRPGG